MAYSPIKLENSGSRPQSSAAKRVSAGKGTSFASVMAEKKAASESVETKKDTTARAKSASTAAKTANAQAAAKTAKTASTSRAAVARPVSPGIPLNRNTGVLAGRTPNDMLRMQNFGKAQSDINSARTMGELMDSMGKTGSTTLDVARNAGLARNIGAMASGNGGRGFALTAADFIHTAPSSLKRGSNRRANGANSGEIGKLSAKFESGGDGIAAIGYDRTGGTSYGKYQIASAVGSMKGFLNFLDEQAPDLAIRLRNSGPANTGSRRGAMPTEWRAIAAEQPERFERLQEAYIRESHYQPAVEAISRRTGLNEKTLSPAMREVIWSTAVQHGPAGAARIFERADNMSGKADAADYEKKMIKNVYNVRAGQFGSSTAKVQNSVRNRFIEERELALGMLQNGNGKA